MNFFLDIPKIKMLSCIQNPKSNGKRVMRYLIIISLLILTSCVHYRPWTKTEKVMLAGSWLAAGADYYTSERALDDPGNHEMNPLIDKHPTDFELATYMLTSQIGITILAHCFPKWRSWLLGGKAAINTGCAIHNSKLD